ncbi:MAG TPA: M24 family metallopeptidase, partial [bacterium]|nr:M24 family metallopeptidase [bacterium]
MNSKVISLKTPEQVEKLRRANRIVAEVLQQMKEQAAAGMSTQDLDDLSVDICRRHKVKPAFLGLYGFPRALCISLNEEVVHGIPSK